MTSSERPDAAAPATSPAATATPRPVVLAQGHLHPAVLLLRLLDALRQTVLPVVFGVLVERWFLVLAAVLFLLQLGYALARYLTFEYVLTTEELITREGLLHRQERRIPLDRIQDLGFESTLLRRFLGLCVVLVETAAGKGVEAVLDSLSRSAGAQLRETLLLAREAVRLQVAERAATAADPSARTVSPQLAAAPEWVVRRATATELLLRGLTDLRLGYIVVLGFSALHLADQLGFVTQMRGAADSFFAFLARFSPAVVAMLLAGLLLTVLGVSVVGSAIGNLVLFHGFVLTLRGEVLQRRYGLLTTRSKALPRARIQRVTFEQNWLRRLLGICVVKADSAGQGRGTGEDTTSGFEVVLPLCDLPNAIATLPALLPGIERTAFRWHHASPKLVLRVTLQGVLLAAALLAIGWPWLGMWALASLLAVPILWSIGRLAYGNLGWALGADYLALRQGIIGRYHAFLPTAKVQSVVVRRSPLAQLLGLAEVTVYVAGGSPTRLPDLTLADATRLRSELAELAAIAAARDWR